MTLVKHPITFRSPNPVVLLAITVFIVQIVDAYEDDSPLSIAKCQRINVPLCNDVPYNFTRLPNMLGHRDQERVTMDVQHFEPLVHTGCSPHVKFFVCSIYTPMCSENVNTPVTSCRTVCEEVKSSCMAILKRFGLHWPEMLNCSKFPERGQLCMEPVMNDKNTPPNSNNNNDGQPVPDKNLFPSEHNYPVAPLPDQSGSGGAVGADRSQARSRCPSDMLDLGESTDTDAAQCFIRCNKSLMFRPEHKKFAELWMGIWAAACCVITAFTVITYALDSSRFRFPERLVGERGKTVSVSLISSIVYLAGCYHFYSWVYVLRAFVIAPDDIACKLDPKSTQSYLIANGLDSPVCALTFIVLYYFSMASSLWWVVLTFTWFLAAGKKWGIEVIDQYSSYFHFVAWGTPALLSIAVLINQKVDANELTSLCFVGASDWRALAGYVIAPLFVLLQIGCAFILAGFVGICSVRQVLILRRDNNVYKLEKLMFKIGVFSVLYVVPAVCVIGCYMYHAYVLIEWEPSSTRYIQCRRDNPHTMKETCNTRPKLPSVELYMLNMFMSLIVGITSGMWVMSRKTCITWKRFICCGNLHPVEQKLLLAASSNGGVSQPLNPQQQQQQQQQQHPQQHPQQPGSLTGMPQLQLQGGPISQQQHQQQIPLMASARYSSTMKHSSMYDAQTQQALTAAMHSGGSSYSARNKYRVQGAPRQQHYMHSDASKL